MADKDYEQVLKMMSEQYGQIFEQLGMEKDFEAYEKSNEYLQRALDATDIKEAKACIAKALKYDPDNLDAKIFKATITETNPIKQLSLFDKLIAEEEAVLRDTDCFEYEGDFWLEVETRPYMRALAHKMTILANLDRTKDAVAIGERMLQLNTNDNMGVRYQLLPLYALLEDLDKAEALYKKYRRESSVAVLLPMAVCYYRRGMYSKSEKLIKKMFEANPHTRTLINADSILSSEADGFYSPGEPSEVYQALEDSRTLLASTISFLDFLENLQNQI